MGGLFGGGRSDRTQPRTPQARELPRLDHPDAEFVRQRNPGVYRGLVLGNQLRDKIGQETGQPLGGGASTKAPAAVGTGRRRQYG